MFKVIETPQAPKPIGPYSQAIQMGDLLFLSGQIPLDPLTGELVGSTASDQAQQVLSNLLAVLKAAGCDAKHVAKTTIFLTDLADFGEVNAVYGKVFGMDGPAPARSTVQVSALPRGCRVEIEAIARIPTPLP
ncbi:MAG: RidA family protein [Fibrobacterota bacterium]|nr:RidA family protein [Fibrobacterota bacterium]QQS05416.1 MAG: RidA family protein [Fibrobacterota bacterium]